MATGTLIVLNRVIVLNSYHTSAPSSQFMDIYVERPALPLYSSV